MNYWLLCLPREVLEHCMKVNTFDLERKNVISNVRKGDKVVCCAGKGDWKVIGLGEVTDSSIVVIPPTLAGLYRFFQAFSRVKP